ncbi:MAG: glycosyltransferase [Anaerolineae bacterium]|nr:glycosyltransferase family 4 protein [Anaerolineae bacterium]MDW8101305.1 glycosyltransferase [Anaerolineae bacterium]
MRVLMVSKACVFKVYRKKLEELAKLGVEMFLVVPRYWRDERGILPLEEGEENYKMLVDDLIFNGNYHLHFYLRLPFHLRKIQPKLVHIDEEPYNLATFQAMVLARKLGARALFFTWQNLYRRYPPPFSWFERYNYHQSSWAIAGNQEAMEVLRRKGYQKSISLIPQFGVDEDIFKPDPARERGQPFIVGYAGRLVEEKGVHLLLRAMARIGGEWELFILGTGPKRRELEELALSLGLSQRTHFLSFLPSSQLPGFYRQLDLLVLPSITKPNWKEQFGRVLIEAMACGVPVIGSTCGEIPNVIGDAGLVFPEGDEEALRESILKLMNDEGLRLYLARKGRERVLERFTQKAVARQTFEVYNKILGGV